MNDLRAALWYMLIALRELPSSLKVRLKEANPQRDIWIATIVMFLLFVGLFVFTEVALWILGLN
ncbi:hypothetical protein CN598_12810 [Bacillus wiedmannii]|nr:hypothetical protein CN598_12810 [Bacillus wiedmannii]